jgi:hypothetical protein
MQPALAFEICNGLALAGWLILVLAGPFKPGAERYVSGLAVALLCGLYGWFLAQSLSLSDMGKMGSLEGVMELFTREEAVLAGWIHYLAFDLFIGCWISRNARRHGIPFFWTLPCLLLSFMAGPLGWLLYRLLRTAKTRRYFAENF